MADSDFYKPSANCFGFVTHLQIVQIRKISACCKNAFNEANTQLPRYISGSRICKFDRIVCALERKNIVDFSPIHRNSGPALNGRAHKCISSAANAHSTECGIIFALCI